MILRALESADIADSRCWADEQGVSHDDVEREMNSLESEGYITKTLNQTLFWELTPAGEEAVAQGSPELVILKALPAEEAAAQADVKAKVGDDVFKGGLGIAKKNGWVEIEKGTGNIVRKVSPFARCCFKAWRDGARPPHCRPRAGLAHAGKRCHAVSSPSPARAHAPASALPPRRLSPQADPAAVEDKTASLLKGLSDALDAKTLKELKRRKLIAQG